MVRRSWTYVFLVAAIAAAVACGSNPASIPAPTATDNSTQVAGRILTISPDRSQLLMELPCGGSEICTVTLSATAMIAGDAATISELAALYGGGYRLDAAVEGLPEPSGIDARSVRVTKNAPVLEHFRFSAAAFSKWAGSPVILGDLRTAVLMPVGTAVRADSQYASFVDASTAKSICVAGDGYRMSAAWVVFLPTSIGLWDQTAPVNACAGR
jgi:hypothetical protein